MFFKHEDIFCVPYFYWKTCNFYCVPYFYWKICNFHCAACLLYNTTSGSWIPSFKWVILIIIVQLLLDVLIVHNGTWLYTVFVSSLDE